MFSVARPTIEIATPLADWRRASFVLYSIPRFFANCSEITSANKLPVSKRHAQLENLRTFLQFVIKFLWFLELMFVGEMFLSVLVLIVVAQGSVQEYLNLDSPAFSLDGWSTDHIFFNSDKLGFLLKIVTAPTVC